MRRFTAVFGMGTGGSTALLTPGEGVTDRASPIGSKVNAVMYGVSVCVALALYGQAARVISTG